MTSYSFDCARCGYCCLVEPCPVIKHLDPGIEMCPQLQFTDDMARCALAGLIVPVGDGCCISARCFKDGKVYDFAALPANWKRALAQKLLDDREGAKNGKHNTG